jgi:ABC-2 type transport system ATP-binding protein
LEAVGVWKRYRRTGPWALQNVTVTIPQGSITALVGPNAAGKSTLIRSWLGFERPTRGLVRVGGVDPQVDRTGALRQVGYVSQSSALYRALTVADHVDLAATLRPGFEPSIAIERLERLGVPTSQAAGSLSGGQAAQVALCLALGTRASILLLDEPLASLDPLARHEFLDVVVSTARDRGVSVLLSSHIVSDVEAACDHLIVLGHGRTTLQSSISSALAEHRVVPATIAAPESTVARFTRPGGEQLALVRSTDRSVPRPSLEDLVMGYLAATRSSLSPGSRPD